MPRKLRVYLENSLISMYYQDGVPYLRDITRRFWREALPGFDVYVSDAVLDEIRATSDADLRDALERLIGDFEVLPIGEEATKLSELYLSRRRMPGGDALHLAAASIGGMDYLVTWNLSHLYKGGTQEMLPEVNTELRIPTPTIVAPDDFFAEEEQDA